MFSVVVTLQFLQCALRLPHFDLREADSLATAVSRQGRVAARPVSKMYVHAIAVSVYAADRSD